MKMLLDEIFTIFVDLVESLSGILADTVLFFSLDGTHDDLPQHLMIFALMWDFGKFATLLTAHIRIRI
jgi:hypothetical protein